MESPSKISQVHHAVTSEFETQVNDDDSYVGRVTDASGLTSQQKDLVKKTWTHICKDMRGTGMNLSIQFCHDYPEYLRLFGIIITTSLERLRENRLLRAHSLSIMVMLNDMIKQGLNDDNLLEVQLTEMAKFHLKRNVKHVYFQDFSCTFMNHIRRMLGKDMTDEVELAWKYFFEKMMAVLKYVERVEEHILDLE